MEVEILTEVVLQEEEYDFFWLPLVDKFRTRFYEEIMDFWNELRELQGVLNV